MEQVQEHLKLSFKQKLASGKFWVTFFEDNGYRIAYLPSLDLSGYGQTDEEATKMLFEGGVHDFFRSLFEEPVAIGQEVLRAYGWRRSRIFEKELSKNTSVETDGILRSFNLSANTPVSGRLLVH